MSKIWMYSAGAWTEIDWDEWDEFPDGEDWPDTLKRLGFTKILMIGEDESFDSLAVYEREEPPRYLVSLSSVDYGATVTADRLPDALDLYARYAPIIPAVAIAEAMHAITHHTAGILDDIMAGLVLNRPEADRTVQRVNQMYADRRRRAVEELREDNET